MNLPEVLAAYQQGLLEHNSDLTNERRTKYIEQKEHGKKNSNLELSGCFFIDALELNFNGTAFSRPGSKLANRSAMPICNDDARAFQWLSASRTTSYNGEGSYVEVALAVKGRKFKFSILARCCCYCCCLGSCPCLFCCCSVLFCSHCCIA